VSFGKRGSCGGCRVGIVTVEPDTRVLLDRPSLTVEIIEAETPVLAVARLVREVTDVREIPFRMRSVVH